MSGPNVTFESYNLAAAERLLCSLALDTAGNVVEAAKLLGITRHALARRMIKHTIVWPRRKPTGDSRQRAQDE
jgi:DNA-binding protein Fis